MSSSTQKIQTKNQSRKSQGKSKNRNKKSQTKVKGILKLPTIETKGSQESPSSSKESNSKNILTNDKDQIQINEKGNNNSNNNGAEEIPESSSDTNSSTTPTDIPTTPPLSLTSSNNKLNINNNTTTNTHITLVKAAKKVMELNRIELCRDMTGKFHVIKEIREKRHKAVLKGMNWLSKFLTANKSVALYAIGDDAPSVFFEIWYTSADSRIRCRAKGIAELLIEKYEKSLLDGKQSKDNNIDMFFECMFLLRCKHEMELDTTKLLAFSDKLWKSNNLKKTDILFGVVKTGLEEVPVADWLMLLMKVMCMEYNNLLHRKRWPIEWGLRECFIALRNVPLQPPPIDESDDEMASEFHHAFYLATHIVYAIGAYSVVKTNVKEVPWLYKYCRESLKFWMRRARRKKTEPELYVDVDGIAECADVLRGTGLTEASDPLLCSASIWLIDTQKKNGQWPVWMSSGTSAKEHSYYDTLHPSWVATQCLRDRDFEIGYTRPGNALWSSFMTKLLAESNFAQLNYKTSYKKGTAQLL